jgi:integrase
VKYWSKGPQNGQTIKKRIGSFIGFLNWLDIEGHYPFPKSLSKYYKTLEGSETIKAILNKEEVNKLYKLDFENEKLNYIKDVFVFSCFTGMRWEELISFNPKDVHQVTDVGPIVEKMAKKTNEYFRVPLNSVALEIINRHNYIFNDYDNANFNKYLKILLKSTGWFDDDTIFLDDNGNYLKRWQCVSVHRGRDSFCTMLVNDRVPLNEIMKYTGHKSISSLMKYIDLKSQIKNFTNELVIP